MSDTPELTLRPDPLVVGRWSMVGALAVGLTLWTAIDMRTSLFAWSFAFLTIVVTAVVVAQWVRPTLFEVRFGDAAIEVGAPWQRLRLPWQSVHLARVTRVVGEDLLELWATADPADTSPRPPMRTVSILLPIGADLDALHALLAARLGLADGLVTAPA